MKRLASCLSVALAATLGPGLTHAQDYSGQPRHLSLLGIPSATVAPHGAVFGSLSYATQRADTDADSADGSLAFGLGLGDANENIGFQLTAQITSLADEFADSGFFDVKASRLISSGRTPLYLGLQVGDLGAWGESEDNEVSAELMLSGFHVFEGGMPMMFTFGIGSHVTDNSTEAGGFAGVGVGLTRNLAASASWYGDYGTIGFSFSPSNNRNISFTASVQDVTDATGDRTGIFNVNYVIPKAFGG